MHAGIRARRGGGAVTYLLLTCGSGSCSAGSNGPGDPAAGACGRSCMYELRDVTTCDAGSGPMEQDGPWTSTCVPRSCSVVQFPSSMPGSENDALIPCSSDRQYRNVQEYLGDCSGQSPSVTASDGGSQHGKADGALCNTNEECLSSNCVSSDGVAFLCADTCASGACGSHETCTGGYCLPACRPSGSGSCMKDADCPSGEVCGASGECEDTQ